MWVRAHAVTVWHWLRFKLNYLNFLLPILVVPGFHVFFSSVSRLGVHVFSHLLLALLSLSFFVFEIPTLPAVKHYSSSFSSCLIIAFYICISLSLVFFLFTRIINWIVCMEFSLQIQIYMKNSNLSSAEWIRNRQAIPERRHFVLYLQHSHTHTQVSL